MKSGYYIALVLVALLCSIGLGPYYTIYQLREGVKSNDPQKITDQVDFVRLRQNLKNQLNAQAQHAVASPRKKNLASALAAGLTGVFAGVIVDQMVTPAGLATMMRGQKVNPLKKSTGTTAEPFGNVRFRFDSKSQFSAYVPDKQGNEIRFVLTREWFDWTLTNIVLPVE